MTTKEEFREFGRAMIDFVADYLENIRERRVLPGTVQIISLTHFPQLVSASLSDGKFSTISYFYDFLLNNYLV
jgi:hypothetical protein